ncbi:MAG: hypothetical protein JW705_05290, partial [Methanosarcinaceae archaeon]|nr:hypothetical protein [Methanosarcinaceae archaeon]
MNNIRIFLTISILFSMFNPVFTASAASGATASVNDLSLDVGETSSVSIYIGNCSNVTSLYATLSFNDSIVEFTGAAVSTGVPGSLTSAYSSGTIDIELTGMEMFTTSSETAVADLSFRGLESGSTDLSLDHVELNTTLGPD